MESKEISKKDKLVYFDKKSLTEPLNERSRYFLDLAFNDPDQHGVIRPDGTINWACPCLGTASIGPCSKFFRDAFTCFHTSQAEFKGSDCLKEFENLQNCMKKYPKLYDK